MTKATVVRGGKLKHMRFTQAALRAVREKEGATWCRGHVTDADPAGRALLVANALSPASPVDGPGWAAIPDGAGGNYTVPVWD